MVFFVSLRPKSTAATQTRGCCCATNGFTVGKHRLSDQLNLLLPRHRSNNSFDYHHKGLSIFRPKSCNRPQSISECNRFVAPSKLKDAMSNVIRLPNYTDQIQQIKGYSEPMSKHLLQLLSYVQQTMVTAVELCNVKVSYYLPEWCEFKPVEVLCYVLCQRVLLSYL